jgi:hypothetical protein
MREFNKGLEASDFRYFIAGGKSAEQMAKYELALYRFAAGVKKLTDAKGADNAVITNKTWQAEILGLAFNSHAAPAGWENGYLIAKTPSGIVDRVAMSNLSVGHAHLYLCAVPEVSDEGIIAPVVRPVLDKWIVASPIRDGKAFMPKDSIEIDAATYATLTNQDPAAIQSPATDPEFGNTYLNAYPFKAKTAAPAPATA